MLRNIFLKTLWDRRRGFLWWGVGMVALSLYVVLLYPMIEKFGDFTRFFEEAPAVMKVFMGDILDFTSPTGYLRTEMFAFSLPMMYLIYAIGFGARTIAGEEDEGTLELILTNPLPRWRVVAEKLAAMAVGILVLALFTYVGLVIGIVIVGMDVNLWGMAQMVLSTVLLSLVFGTLALAVGCGTGRKGASIGIAAALAVATYFFNTLAALSDRLSFLQKTSPFYYYLDADPLNNGLKLSHVALLLFLVILFSGGAIGTFQRRDVMV